MPEKKKLIHMMGICGTAMGSLAGLLKDLGYDVRGSDQNVYPPMSTRLESLGIKIMEGYKPENLEPKPDLVIVGNVMSRNNSEVQALLESKISYMSLPQAMGEFLIRDRHSVVVAGTHGKTTTTALAAWVLEQGGLKPGFLIGGVPVNFPQTFSVAHGNYFVIEGDEYDTAFFDKVPKFIHYKPKSVILTSIEFDHADIYKDLNAVKEAFKMLLKLIPDDGQLIYNGADKNIREILTSTKCKTVQSYGLKNEDWTLSNIRWEEKIPQFDVFFRGEKKDTLETKLFGEYNLLNILSVYATAINLGIDLTLIKNAISSYGGVKRRQEIIGTPNGITVIEDFAHHPTAVAVTLDGVRKRFKKSKIIAVFEPRSATSRRKIFQNEFAEALSHADQVIVSEPYDQAKIVEDERFDSQAIVDFIKAKNQKAQATVGESVSSILKILKESAKSGDVILIMSNGGFGGIYKKLLDLLA
jgi:UDP-N-acetylmuramate: L-alanyl-gamma-D-glutamyl-meso-diaminopimelate ligase